jgi:hypothetical protein
MPIPIKIYAEIKLGDYYEDCAYHPCICMHINAEADEILGISLVDGSYPRACSITHCGVQKLTLEEALKWKLFGPENGVVREEKRWWSHRP